MFVVLSLSICWVVRRRRCLFSFSGAGETQARCGLGFPLWLFLADTHFDLDSFIFLSFYLKVSLPRLFFFADARLLGLGGGFSGLVGLACTMHCMQRDVGGCGCGKYGGTPPAHAEEVNLCLDGRMRCIVDGGWENWPAAVLPHLSFFPPVVRGNAVLLSFSFFVLGSASFVCFLQFSFY